MIEILMVCDECKRAKKHQSNFALIPGDVVCQIELDTFTFHFCKECKERLIDKWRRSE